PTGPNRFSPTRTPEPWDGIKFCNKYSPVCPQKLPNISDESKVLEKMPRGRYEHLKRLLPYLQNQSEDCLYLNIYTPLQGKIFMHVRTTTFGKMLTMKSVFIRFLNYKMFFLMLRTVSNDCEYCFTNLNNIHNH
ncbi:hypothetical protein WDU94_001952, partial [Cyamophila willieti]